MLSGINYMGGKVEGFFIIQRSDSEYVRKLDGRNGHLVLSNGSFLFTAGLQNDESSSIRFAGTYKRSETKTFSSYVLSYDFESSTNTATLRWPKREFLHRFIQGTRIICFWLGEKFFFTCSWNKAEQVRLFGANGILAHELNKARPLGYFKSFLDEDDLIPSSRKYLVQKKEDEITTPMKWALEQN